MVTLVLTDDQVAVVRAGDPVTPAQTIDAFTASPASIVVGSPVVVNWSTSNATAVRLNGTVVPASGSLTFTPTANTSYVLEADGAVATISQSVTVAVAQAQTTAGWKQLPNTKIRAVAPLPSPGGTNGVVAVVGSWSGAAARTKAGSEQLIIWGGGHNDYYGNEVYALNLFLPVPTMTRLTDPSVVDLNGGDAFVFDGYPVARHTYNGLAYLPDSDQLFAFEGARMPNGSGGGYTWTFDLGTTATPRWHSMQAVPNGTSVTGAVCAYDPNSKSVIANWGNNFMFERFSTQSKTWTQLTGFSESIVSYTSTAVIDPKRKRMYFFGGVDPLNTANLKICYVDISEGSTFAVIDITAETAGTCDGLAKASWPGLAYDESRDKIIGYPNSGDVVYVFDCDTHQATALTFPGGPAASSAQGSFGRFRRFPSLDLFAFVNDVDRDAYVLRLPPVVAADMPPVDSTPTDPASTDPTTTPPSDTPPVISVPGASTALQNELTANGYAPARIWYLAPGDTFAAIAPKVQPGDAIILRDKWNGSLNPPSGAPGAPILIMSYPGEMAALDGSTGSRFDVLDRSWIIVDRLTTLGAACITGGSSDASPVSLFHDNVFRRLDTSGSGPQGLGGISAFNGLVNVLVEDCHFHDVGGSGQHCIYLGSRGTPSSNVTVRRNVCSDAPYNGMHFNGRFSNLVVEQNIIHDAGISGISCQQGVSDSFIRNNLIYNFANAGVEFSNYPGDCALFGQGGTGAICPYDQTRNLIEFNTIYSTDHNPVERINATPRGIHVVNGAVNKVGNLGGNTYRNNIFVGFGFAGHYPTIVFMDTDKDYLKTSVFDSNIFWSLDGATDPYVLGFGYSTDSYGFQPYTLAQMATMTTVRRCLVVDPKFVAADPTFWDAPSKFDFHLQPGSPAIGAGAPGSVMVDFANAARANPPSIGAYEAAQ